MRLRAYGDVLGKFDVICIIVTSSSFYLIALKHLHLFLRSSLQSPLTHTITCVQFLSAWMCPSILSNLEQHSWRIPSWYIKDLSPSS